MDDLQKEGSRRKLKIASASAAAVAAAVLQ